MKQPPNPQGLDLFGEVRSLFDGVPDTGPMPHRPQSAATHGNLAVQRSLMDIFDEFTQIISGELKSMDLNEWNPDQSSDNGSSSPPKAQ